MPIGKLFEHGGVAHENTFHGDAGWCGEGVGRRLASRETAVNQIRIRAVLGLAKNGRLIKEIAHELAQARTQFEQSGEPSRVFKDFCYQTLKSWSRSRRVIGKAEHLAKGGNPRFVTTLLPANEFDAKSLCEDEYCARGDMENRIKEQQLCLFADRTSAAAMRANELCLWFSSMAYTLMTALRRLGLEGTDLSKARCDTIRLKLLRISARIRVTVRNVWVSLGESCPYQDLFRQVYDHLAGLSPIPLRC